MKEKERLQKLERLCELAVHQAEYAAFSEGVYYFLDNEKEMLKEYIQLRDELNISYPDILK